MPREDSLSAVQASDLAWLTGSEGAQALHAANARLAPAAEPGPNFLAVLRKELGAERARLVAQQTVLRRRARDKFARAGAMFFTRQGLEQATDDVAAGYKAARFAGRGPLVDLCCGVGGDLLALAQAAATVGVDADPLLAHFAAANAQAYGAAVETRASRAEETPLEAFAAWHIDPDRRPDGKRTAWLAAAQPGEPWLRQLLARQPHGALKAAPAAEAPADWAAQCEREWLQTRGECRQQLLWFGDFFQVARRATVLDSLGAAHSLCERTPGSAPTLPPLSDRPWAYLYEPQPAVLAAGLAGVLADQHGLAPLTPLGGYLTGENALYTPFAQGFAVLESLPFDRRKLRSLARERGWSLSEVKKRGVELDPARLARELAGAAGEPLTLVVFAGACGVTAVIARRLAGPTART